jgi:hypothetical protein
MNTLLSRALLCALVVAGLYAAEAAAQENGQIYAVTITNVTRGQVITPALIAAHTEDFSLFELGQPASPALATPEYCRRNRPAYAGQVCNHQDRCLWQRPLPERRGDVGCYQ